MTLGRPRLAGRERELELLESVWQDAATGRPRIVVVAGEPGIGKTRLVEEFLERLHSGDSRAADSGGSMMVGDCLPMLDGAVAYAPFVAAFERPAGDPAAAARARELLRQNVPGTSQADVWTSVQEVLTGAAAEQPLLLALEDMHWADRSTLQLLTYLDRALRRGFAGRAGSAPAPRLLLILTRRDEPADCQPGVEEFFSELSRSPLTVNVPLCRLPDDDMCGLLTDLGAEGDLGPLVARAEGNPLFAQELAAGDLDVTTAVRDLLSQRLRPLHGDALTVMQAAAVLGLRCRHRDLLSVTELGDGKLLPAVRDVVAASVLVADAGEYRFRHALLHEVAYNQLLPGERQTLHRRAARALIDGGSSPPATIAGHLSRAEDWPRALQWWIRAGEDYEQSGAPDEAAVAFAEAVQLWEVAADPGDVDALLALLDRTAAAYDKTGQSFRSVEYYARALALQNKSDRTARHASILARYGYALTFVGRQRQAQACFQTVESWLEELPSCRDTVTASFNCAWGLISMGHTARAEALAQRCLRIARECGADDRVPSVLSTLACVTDILHGMSAARELFEEAIRQLRMAGDTYGLLGALAQLQEGLGAAGEMEEAIRLASEAEQLAAGTAYEISGQTANLLCTAAYFATKIGRYDLTDELMARGGPIAEAIGRDLYAMMGVGPGLLARGRVDEAEALLVEAAAAPEASTELGRMYFEMLAELQLLQRHRDAAHEAVQAGLRLVAGTDEEPRSGRLLLLGLRNQAEAAELARARRLPAAEQAAIQLTEQLLETVAAMPQSALGATPWAHVTANPAVIAQAASEAARVHGTDQADDWRAAAGLWRELGRPQPACYCELRAAAALIWHGAARSQVAEQVRLAHRAAAELGVQPLISEAEQMARRARVQLTTDASAAASGGIPAPSAADPAESCTPAEPTGQRTAYGLTERELDVLAQLTEGLTNAQIAKRLFISPRTVNVHVMRIFTKLGVSSRVQAAGIAHALGIRPAGQPHE